MSPTSNDNLDIAYDDADLRKPILTEEEDNSILVFSGQVDITSSLIV